MRIDPPGGGEIDLHRRCWIGRGGATPAGCVRVAASALGYEFDLDFVFPMGCGVFKAGGDLAFHHGGPSLQEIVIPVVTVRMKARETERANAGPVTATGLPDRAVLAEGIPDAAYAVLTGDDKDTARFYLRANRDAREGQRTMGYGGDITTLPTARPFARRFTDLGAMPEDDLAQIAAKAAHLRSLREATDFHMAELACNLYVAAFLLPKIGGPPASRGARRIPTTDDLWQALRGEMPYGPLVGAAETARTARAFHWPLEFPAVMARGGFDVVLGNPPWELLQLSEREYFADRMPDIAELAGAARKRAIADLETSRPQAFNNYVVAKRAFDAGNEFARASGRFDLTARGKINSYGLFAELFAALAGPAGRAGVIVPTGIATDAGTAPFFGSLIDTSRIASLIDFENRAGLFPAVHSAMKFCMLTLGHDVEEAAFAFFLTDPAQLSDPERNFTLAAAAIAAINPNTKTAPVFRARVDAELTAKIYANVPVLIDESKGAVVNTWGVEFRQGLFNMTSDSGLFRSAAQLGVAGYVRNGTDWVAEGARPQQAAMALGGGRDARHLDLQGGGPRGPARWVPLYEAKMIDFFDHRSGGYATRGDDRGYRVLPETTAEEHADPDFEVTPFYWIDRRLVEDGLFLLGWQYEWLIGFKDITSPTNERTFISAPVPRWGVGNNMPLIFPMRAPSRPSTAALIANMSALVLDFVVRQKAGGVHMNFFYVKQFPVLPPDFYTANHLAFIVSRVLELTYTSRAMAPFARDLGHGGSPFAWDEDRRAHLRAELDAFYARAYGLTRDELRYILDPSDVKGADYPSETFRVLKTNEIRRFGDYRTARLVLAAWDRFETDGTFALLGL